MAQSINLDLVPGKSYTAMITASQGDVGREFIAHLFYDGESYTPPAGATITINGHKPDGTVFEYEATYSGSTVTFQTKEQMTIVSGRVTCELRIKGSDGLELGTSNFFLNIEPSPFDSGTKSQSEISSLGEMYAKIREDAKVAEKAVDAARVVTENTAAIDFIDKHQDTLTAITENLPSIQSVGNNIPSVKAANDNKTNIDTVSASIDSIDMVAGNVVSVQKVAGNISDVKTVSENITKLSEISENISKVSAMTASVDTVAANADSVKTVAGSINDIKAANKSASDIKASMQATQDAKTASATSEANAAASASDAASSATAAEASQTAAESSEKAAKTSETNAASSAKAAKTSETNAKTSETAASDAATAAATSAAAAKTSETNAAASAQSAAEAQTAAADSASAAKDSETNAAASAKAANEAKEYAEVATDAVKLVEEAKDAKLSASASEEAAKAARASAEGSANEAKASANNSAASATAAADSAAASKTSETNAAASATEAKKMADALSSAKEIIDTSIYSSEAWAVGTKDGTPVAETDPQYENSAKAWAEKAAGSESAVTAAKDAAADSEAKAKASEDNAKDSADKAAASEDAAKASGNAAAQSAAAAKASEENAATSEMNAKTSETNAASTAASIQGTANAMQTYADRLDASKSVIETDLKDANNLKSDCKTIATDTTKDVLAANRIYPTHRFERCLFDYGDWPKTEEEILDKLYGYDMAICGGPGSSFLPTAVSAIKKAHRFTKLFVYITIGGSGSKVNAPITTLYSEMSHIAHIGGSVKETLPSGEEVWEGGEPAYGVFMDEAGYDFGTTRERQNLCIQRAHNLGLSVFLNSWGLDDAFSSEKRDGFNPSGTATLLNDGDYYLAESCNFRKGPNDVGTQVSALSGAKKVYDYYTKYRKTYGTRIITYDYFDATGYTNLEMKQMHSFSVLNCLAMGGDGFSNQPSYPDYVDRYLQPYDIQVSNPASGRYVARINNHTIETQNKNGNTSLLQLDSAAIGNLYMAIDGKSIQDIWADVFSVYDNVAALNNMDGLIAPPGDAPKAGTATFAARADHVHPKQDALRFEALEGSLPVKDIDPHAVYGVPTGKAGDHRYDKYLYLPPDPKDLPNVLDKTSYPNWQDDSWTKTGTLDEGTITNGSNGNAYTYLNVGDDTDTNLLVGAHKYKLCLTVTSVTGGDMILKFNVSGGTGAGEQLNVTFPVSNAEKAYSFDLSIPADATTCLLIFYAANYNLTSTLTFKDFRLVDMDAADCWEKFGSSDDIDTSKLYITAGKKTDTELGGNATAEGYNVTASGYYSHAEGAGVQATGTASHAEGQSVISSAAGSHAEGISTRSTAAGAHAEGQSSAAFGEASHAEGYATVASGACSHAEGELSTAFGSRSHAEGENTKANHRAQHTFGAFNVEDPNEAASDQRGDYIEIVGNGTADDARSNARTLDWSGNEWIAGDLKIGGSGANDSKAFSVKDSLNTIANLQSLSDGYAKIQSVGALPSDTNAIPNTIYMVSNPGGAHRKKYAYVKPNLTDAPNILAEKYDYSSAYGWGDANWTHSGTLADGKLVNKANGAGSFYMYLASGDGTDSAPLVAGKKYRLHMEITSLTKDTAVVVAMRSCADGSSKTLDSAASFPCVVDITFTAPAADASGQALFMVSPWAQYTFEQAVTFKNLTIVDLDSMQAGWEPFDGVQSSTITEIKVMTQTAYDALETKSDSILYVITASNSSSQIS